eukprot:tig00000821_g4524.t1
MGWHLADADAPLPHAIVKVLLAQNVLFVVIAIIIISLGSWAANDKLTYITDAKIPVGVIFMGIVLCALGAMGMYAIIKHKRELMLAYGIGLFAVAVIFLGLLIALFEIARNSATPGHTFYNTMQKAYAKSVAKDPTAVCDLMRDLGCSGFDKPCTDAADASLRLYCPASCSFQPSTSVACFPKVQASLANSFRAVGGTVLAFDILLFFGVIFSVLSLFSKRDAAWANI